MKYLNDVSYKDCDWWNGLGVSEVELDVIKYL